jgi:hypothetical protein
MRKVKRVSRIAEVTCACIEELEPSEIFTDIMYYDPSQECLLAGEALEQGQSELIGKIARKWGVTIDTAIKNIELRARIKEKIAAEGVNNPFLLEAEAVSEANNMFWLLSDSVKANNRTKEERNEKTGSKTSNRYVFENIPESGSEVYLEDLYRRWEIWFENFVRERSGEETRVTEKDLLEEKHLLEEKQPSEDERLSEYEQLSKEERLSKERQLSNIKIVS